MRSTMMRNGALERMRGVPLPLKCRPIRFYLCMIVRGRWVYFMGFCDALSSNCHGLANICESCFHQLSMAMFPQKGRMGKEAELEVLIKLKVP